MKNFARHSSRPARRRRVSNASMDRLHQRLRADRAKRLQDVEAEARFMADLMAGPDMMPIEEG